MNLWLNCGLSLGGLLSLCSRSNFSDGLISLLLNTCGFGDRYGRCSWHSSIDLVDSLRSTTSQSIELVCCRTHGSNSIAALHLLFNLVDSIADACELLTVYASSHVARSQSSSANGTGDVAVLGLVDNVSNLLDWYSSHSCSTDEI